MALEQLRNKFNKHTLSIMYKLLNDLLFVEIVFFLVALIGEGLLPGVVTSHVGFSKILIAVGATILAILYTGRKAGIELPRANTNKKTAILLILILLGLFLVSLIKINIVLNILITLSSATAAYFIYRLLLEEN